MSKVRLLTIILKVKEKEKELPRWCRFLFVSSPNMSSHTPFVFFFLKTVSVMANGGSENMIEQVVSADLSARNPHPELDYK
jgi:hypothetical protein